MKLVFKTVFFLFIFFLISCKKDKKDNQPPIISISSPGSGQAYKMFDTIGVTAHVSDNEHLSYVNVTLTDLSHSPLQGSYSVPVTSANFIFNISYILTQFHIQSGMYYIQVTADDGYNTVSSYQPISITESPTQLWGYCTVLKNSSQTINQVDTLNSTISTISLSRAYNGMKYGTYNQQLYINGDSTEAFESFNLMQTSPFHQSAFNANATVNQKNYTCLFTDGYKPYVGFLNGDIYSFTNTGSYSTSYRLNDNTFYPYCFTTTSLYGVAAFKSTNATVSDKLTTFYVGSGARFNNVPLPTANFKVVAMFEKGQDSLYILGNNSNNQAQFYIYLLAENVFSDSLIMNSTYGKMLSAVKINNEYVMFSTTTGIYPIVGISLNVALSSTYTQKLCYQPKLNRLMAASNATLSSYHVNATSLSLISTKALGDSIIDFEVITNK